MKKRNILIILAVVAVVAGIAIWLKTKKFKKVKLTESSNGIYLYDSDQNRITPAIDRPVYAVIDTTKTYTRPSETYPFYGLRKAVYSDGRKVKYDPNDNYISSILFE